MQNNSRLTRFKLALLLGTKLAVRSNQSAQRISSY